MYVNKLSVMLYITIVFIQNVIGNRFCESKVIFFFRIIKNAERKVKKISFAIGAMNNKQIALTKATLGLQKTFTSRFIHGVPNRK